MKNWLVFILITFVTIASCKKEKVEITKDPVKDSTIINDDYLIGTGNPLIAADKYSISDTLFTYDTNIVYLELSAQMELLGNDPTQVFVWKILTDSLPDKNSWLYFICDPDACNPPKDSSYFTFKPYGNSFKVTFSFKQDIPHYFGNGKVIFGIYPKGKKSAGIKLIYKPVILQKE